VTKELDFEGLGDYLLGISRECVVRWLPGGTLRGKEYVCGDLMGGKGDSLSVNINTGRWSDFATNDRGGDLISLYAAIQHIQQGDAAKQLALEYNYNLGSDTAPKARRASPVLIPPPGAASVPNMKTSNFGEPEAYWTYRDFDAYPIFYIARYKGGDRGKTFLPWCYVGNNLWVCKAWPEPRPLYGLDILRKSPKVPVMIVEGEKTADAARLMCGKYYAVITWPNGSKAWQKADWTPLEGRKKILLVPDADRAGVDAMEGIASKLQGHVLEIKIVDVRGMKRGSDLADLPEWIWDDFFVWAKKRAKVFPYPEVITPEPLPEVPELTPISPEVVIEPKKSERQVPLIDNSKTVNIDVKIGDSDPSPTPRLRDKWREMGLVLSDSLIPICNINNAIRILENDPHFKVNIWYDQFHQKFFTGDVNGVHHEWADVDNIRATNHIQGELGLRRISDEHVYKAVIHHGHKNKRNEPLEWFKTLVWDEKPRLEEFFHKYMGAKLTEYTKVISKNFWISIVARIYHPGCKADNMIILEGKQGRFKSMALGVIGGKFYIEAHESVMNKDFYMILQGKFLIEVSELDAFSKAESNTIKKVISNQTDRFRMPYGRFAQDFPRQCIFAGTTNESLYLKDHTGGRRFWPIETKRIHVDKIKDDREQLFAEAIVRFKAGEDWYNVPEEETEKVQESRRLHDEWENIIGEYIFGKREITTKQIALDVLHIEAAKLDIGSQRRIGRIMTSYCWDRKTVRVNGIPAKIWMPIDEPELWD